MSTLTEEEKVAQRAHKRRQRGRNKERFADGVQETIQNVKSKGVFERFPVQSLAKMDFVWGNVPPTLDPSYNLKGKRGYRKRQQCESFARALKPLIENIHNTLLRPVRIVDFGSGTGNASLPLSFWFRDIATFTLVDRYEVPTAIAAKRATEAGLTNVQCICQYINEFKDTKESFDIGFSSHACGSASDDALATSLAVGASFIIISCCVGKLKYAEGEMLPRSAWMREYLTREEYLELTRAGDHSERDGDENLSEYKQDCKLLLEIDRLAMAEETTKKKYKFLCLAKLDPADCSAKNDIIMGLHF